MLNRTGISVAAAVFVAVFSHLVAEGGYRGAATAAAVRHDAGLPLEFVKRSDTARGFVVLPRRWIVERTFGWLGRCRRLAKYYQILRVLHAHGCGVHAYPHSSGAMVCDVMATREVDHDAFSAG